MGQFISFKSEINNPWFTPWFILLHTHLNVCATVEGQCLEYLVCITLISGWKISREAVKLRYTIITIFLVSPPIKSALDILGALLRHLLLYLLTSIHEWFRMAHLRYTVVWTIEKEIKLLIGPKQFFSPFDSWKRNLNKNS